MKIGLETESMHLWFQNGRMDIFSYIDFAKNLGCEGVIINIIKDFGLDEEWGCLGSDDENHLKKIKVKLDEYNMYCEIDSKGFNRDKFEKIAKVASILGAKIIRSYVPLTDKNKKVKHTSDGAYDDSKITARFDKEDFLATKDKIKALIPILEKYDLKLAIENHEYQTSEDLLDLLKLININVEQCYPYCATFKREKGTGGVKELGKGAFKIEKSLFEDLKAMQYYYPQEVSQECLERLLKLQKKVVRKV
ncbi:hypothetical protein P0Q23_02920 [Campylobacter jejuni]|uniref:sugar phosphate isomerase/epimerase family protein n=1 Tax=Campylobacter jejuni TaxID=197 RepID=UPI002DBB6527|nr:hypothetical protein [Campylobacter jejuni]MEC4213333.1 hypothetical protein [Campylobacter jejuni]